MTERDLQLAIVQHWRSSLVCAAPNYTPAGWWECDVWGVLKSGNWVEWECKTSRADLRADVKKHVDKWNAAKQCREKLAKHDRLATSAEGPSRFWYVVPEALCIDKTEIPDWAGFAMVDEYRGHPGFWNVHIVKPAPARGSFKAGAREIRLAQRRMWYRYWNCLSAMNRRGIAEPSEAKEHA
jgi:hypothetical protein